MLLKYYEERRNLKLPTWVRRVFHPISVFLFMRLFAHITDFYGSSVKNYVPKNTSHDSGSHMCPFELKKVKTSPQYWFPTSTTW